MEWKQNRMTLVLSATLAWGAILTITSRSRGIEEPAPATDLGKSEISTVGGEPAALTETELEKLFGIDPWSYARILGLPLPLVPLEAFRTVPEETSSPAPASRDLGAAPTGPVFGIEKESAQTIVVGVDGPTPLELEKVNAVSPVRPDPGSIGGER